MADSGAEKKRVVVIGGGVAGSLIARSLQDEANVTLVDMKEFFEMPWAALRSMCDPSFAKRAVFSHSEYLPRGKVVTSAATDITETEVVTAKGDRVAYDFAVIATGHSETGAFTKDEKFTQYQADHETIKSAKSILVIGGGQTGVELAAEIAVDYPDKKVTIVHRGSMLLEFIGETASNKVVHWLKQRKVDIILGQSVDVNIAKDGVYKTSGGQTIDAECHFICTGKPIGSGWLKETVLKDCLDIHGRLMVDSNLKVKGRNNVFGIGDITDIPELKLGYLAQRHAGIATKNIKLLMKNANDNNLNVYKPALPLSLIALGKREAVAQFYCISCIGRLPGMIKSGDLYVGRTRKQLGLLSE
ncbi:apoptosis-inducing factor B isoform X2 [Capsicum annuum]